MTKIKTLFSLKFHIPIIIICRYHVGTYNFIGIIILMDLS